MKKIVLSFLAIPLLLPMPAAGQNSRSDKPSTTKSITISGRISDDGKSLIAKNGESWSVTNPDLLSGHFSQQVKVKCQTTSDHHILVVSVKSVPTQATYRVNLSDAAFRR
jgi:hypothetical protein